MGNLFSKTPQVERVRIVSFTSSADHDCREWQMEGSVSQCLWIDRLDVKGASRLRVPQKD